MVLQRGADLERRSSSAGQPSELAGRTRYGNELVGSYHGKNPPFLPAARVHNRGG
jgi:hypothetical protein